MVVDTKTYNKRPNHKPPSATHVSYGTKKCACACDTCADSLQGEVTDSNHKLRKLNDEDKLLCISTIHGFVLSRKVWEKIRVDKLKPTCWQEDPMKAIVMDGDVRTAILHLLHSPLFFSSGASTEMSGNKGKGFVVLLHGGSGTGKTLTVESIAEHLKRPLYVLTGGELGSTPEEVNTKLGDVLSLSFRWKAITLIEEADLFLQPPSREDNLRTNLASCNHRSSFLMFVLFLRLLIARIKAFHRNLEYFQGVLFITTSRLCRQTVDSAIFSRAHIVIHYPCLKPDERQEVWQNSVREFPSEEVEMSNQDFHSLAMHDIDGRRISSITRIAMMFAKTEGEKLMRVHFEAALVIGGVEIKGQSVSSAMWPGN